jgi:hypothetical protein
MNYPCIGWQILAGKGRLAGAIGTGNHDATRLPLAFSHSGDLRLCTSYSVNDYKNGGLKERETCATWTTISTKTERFVDI